MTLEDPSLSVVVPVYRSAPLLHRLVNRLEAVLREQTDEFEVLLVNDGSPDESWEVIQSLTEERTWLRGINLRRNYGQHNALLCGIRNARNEFIITMDDDLQNPPEEIPVLLAKLKDGFDVVYGTPGQQQHGMLRNAASQMTKWSLGATMGAEIAPKVSTFRAFGTQIREAFSSYNGPFVNIDVLLTWATARFGAVSVKHDPRPEGESNYTFRKLVLHALNMLTGFSVLPLQLASITGFVFTFFGFVVLVYVIGRYLLEGTTVAGFPFLASVIAIFSGAQLFSIGIIGEYLARMHLQSMGRPPYAVLSTTPLSEGKRLRGDTAEQTS